jgi:hypothetical protein
LETRADLFSDISCLVHQSVKLTTEASEISSPTAEHSREISRVKHCPETDDFPTSKKSVCDTSLEFVQKSEGVVEKLANLENLKILPEGKNHEDLKSKTGLAISHSQLTKEMDSVELFEEPLFQLAEHGAIEEKEVQTGISVEVKNYSISLDHSQKTCLPKETEGSSFIESQSTTAELSEAEIESMEIIERTNILKPQGLRNDTLEGLGTKYSQFIQTDMAGDEDSAPAPNRTLLEHDKNQPHFDKKIVLPELSEMSVKYNIGKICDAELEKEKTKSAEEKNKYNTSTTETELLLQDAAHIVDGQPTGDVTESSPAEVISKVIIDFDISSQILI